MWPPRAPAPERRRGTLAGPPFVLPAALDRVSEAWFRAPPRARVLLGVAVAVALLAAGLAQAVTAPHGPPVSVHVATRHLGVGEQLSTADVRRVSWPSGLVPDGADVVPDGVLRAPLPRGAVLTDAHLGSGGPAADLPDGRVAVPVPLEALPTIEPGTSLDLVGVRSDGAVVLLTTDALVVQDDGTRVWVSVEATDVLDVSAAVAGGAITAVVRPP